MLLVGDLTDDGQRPNIRAALALVAEYRERHGIRVLMTPGNHDFYALAGRPQDKSFLMTDGTPLLLRSADCPEAATLGTAEALAMLSGLASRRKPAISTGKAPSAPTPGRPAVTKR